MKIRNAALAMVMGLIMGGVALAGDFVQPPTSLPLPLKKHVQRFVDSTQTRDYQPYPRTYRASPRPLRYHAPSDRFYGTVGNSYFAYTASSLTTGGFPLQRYSPRYNGATEVPGELYLVPAGLYDKFMPGSGWTPRTADGQQFLTDFDIDNRGIHYIAYSSFGWGMLKDQGGGFQLLWHNDPSSTQVLPTNQVCTGDLCPSAENIVAMTDGSNYYALVGNGGTWGLWNTTVPESPTFLGAWTYQYRIRANASGTMIAATNGTSNVRLITTSQFVSGNREGMVVPLGGSIWATAEDGDDFWFLPFSGGTTFYKVSSGGSVTAYAVNGSTLGFFTAQAGADYVVGVNGPTPTDLRLYSVNGNTVQEATAVTSYMKTYYKDQNEQPSSVRHHGMTPIRYNGKTYLVWSMHSVGDVYEVQAGDSISISRNMLASLGTKNTNSPNKDAGPYYGDLVTYDVVFSGTTPPSTINWTFGNPESATNSATSGANASVTHRYEGLSSSAAIGAAKTVSAVAAGLPDINDSENLTLLVPKARVLVPGTNELVETAKALGDLFLGASFFDAADGVIEGHEAGWSLDGGTETLQAAGTGFGVGGCGVHTLSFAARYDSYSSTISGMSYTVRPFVTSADLDLGASTPTTVTFNNTSKVGTGFDPLAVWKEKWELVNGAGTVLLSQNATDDPSPLGNKTTFTVNKIDIPAGGTIRLTISMDSTWAPAGCEAYLTDIYEIPLEKPDPDIVRTLCSAPTTASGSCTLSVTSLSGGSQSGWTYQWYLDSQFASSSATYTPSFGTTGSHSVRLIATNPFGQDEDTVVLSVAAPPCDGAPPQGSLTFTETPLGGNARQFDAAAFGYSFQECDSFAWNFGDGSTGTGRSVQHTFTADGTYSVGLTVTNQNGSASVNRSITIGTVAPPPPPPPPPPTCADPTNKVFVNYLGPQSGCKPGLGSPDCFVGEQVKFTVDTYGVTLAACHSYNWTFGDGSSSSSASPSKAFAAAGTFNVSLSVSNGTTTGSHTSSLKTKLQTCGTQAPSGLTISYFGTTSGCAPTNSTPCKEGEDFIFSIVSDGSYQILGCETVAWDFGDGATSNTNQPRHTFAGTGPFTVSLGVTNTFGTHSTSEAVRFFDPSVPKPVVLISPVSTKAKIGASIHFVGNFQTGQDHPLVAINWKVIRTTFGDDVIRTVNNTGDITHEFNEIGDYRIELTATNAGGVSTPAVALVTVAEVQEYSFIIPVVAHLPGSNGTQWRTDLQIFNTDPLKGPLELEFDFKGGTAPIKKTFTMTSSTQIYEDFLGELSKPFPPLEDAGPVVVHARGDSPPQMWTRTYTVDASGHGSYGQLIPAVSLDSSLEAEDQTVTYVLPGLEISSRFRTNVGIVNPSTETVGVTVTARDDSALGFPIGSFDIQVPPLALVQIGNLMDRISGIELGSPFSLNLRTLGNSPIVVYGSMIDQISNDPVYITGVRDIDQQGDHKKIQVVPGAGHLEQSNGTWRSDVVIYNSDVLPIHFDLDYYDGAGNEVAEALNQPLGPGAFVRVEDVLKWPTLSTDPGDSFGLIRVETRETVERYPVVFERTYKDRGELGSFGQGIPAISPDDANVTVGEPAFIAGVRSDESFYTNLGLVAVGDEPSVVRVTLLDEGSGNAVGIWQYVVDGQVAGIDPNASLIVTNIIRAISPLATRGSLKIEVVSGGGVWAYASVIAAADPTCNCTRDEHTFDPEYVPAVKVPTP